MTVGTFTRLTLLSCLATGPLAVSAQPGHWRVGLQLGVANPRSEFTSTPAIPANQFTIRTTTGVGWQVNLERSLGAHWGLRAGLGRVRLPYSMTHQYETKDAAGRPVSFGGGASGGGDVLSFATIGLTANTPAWGPLILTAGLDLQTRYNRRAKSTLVYGGYGSSMRIQGGDTLRHSVSHLFTPEPTAMFTLALVPQLGLDLRISTRLFLSVAAGYHWGLGDIRRAMSPIRINQDQYEGRFSHTGSYMGYRAGLKYSIGRVNPLDKLQYTAYNGPQPRTGWYESERARTFRRQSWLTGGRLGYFSASFIGYELSFQGYGAYFIVDRIAVGLTGTYGRDYRHSLFPIVRSWLVGPLLRLHITTTRIAPFVEVAYQVGRIHFDRKSTTFPYPNLRPAIRVLTASAGVSMRLTNRFRLDLAGETEKYANYPINRAAGIRPKVGLTYFMGKK